MTFLNSLECSRRYLFTSKCAARSIMVQRAPNLNNVDESYDFLKNWGVILAGTVLCIDYYLLFLLLCSCSDYEFWGLRRSRHTAYKISVKSSGLFIS